MVHIVDVKDNTTTRSFSNTMANDIQVQRARVAAAVVLT